MKVMPLKSKYYELLKDPRWQKRRLEIMQRDNFECRKCGDTKTTLNVHHRYYVTGRDPWEYPAFSLITLCIRCHEMERDVGGESCPSQHREWERILAMLMNDTPEDDVWNFIVAIADTALSSAEPLPELFAAIQLMLNDPSHIEVARAAIKQQKGPPKEPDKLETHELDNPLVNAHSHP
jgi:hypothetical protein